MYKWDYFEDIVCISCKESTKRREHCDLIFKKYQIPARYHIVERHPGGGNPGCFESHITILTQCNNTNKKNVLIFEDDIVISNSLTPENLDKCIQFMKEHTWDLFYIGAVPDVRKWYKTYPTCYDNIYKLNSICTHAYVANNSIIKKYSNLVYNNIPIDYLFRDDKTISSYAYYPTLFYQETGYINKFSQSSINTYFRCLEWYAYYINIPLNELCILLLFIFILLVIIL